MGSSQRPIAQIPLSHPNSNSKCQLRMSNAKIQISNEIPTLHFVIWYLFELCLPREMLELFHRGALTFGIYF